MAAFGKDPAQLEGIGTHRQIAVSSMNTRREGGGNRGRRGGGGGVPTFVDRFQPSIAEEDTVRLLAGNYTIVSAVDDEHTVEEVRPYVTFTDHFDGQSKKSTTCSAGPFSFSRDKRDPCRGCDMFWEHRQANGKPGARVSKRNMYAFGVLHYASYARAPQVDRKTGAARIDQKTGKPYMEWCRVPRHQQAAYASYEQRSAHRLHWPMGVEHFGVLWEYDSQIGKSCVTCGGVGTIASVAWICGDPKCGEEVIDCETTTLPPEQVTKLTTSRDTVCPAPNCRKRGFLKEVISCKNCTPVGREPRRSSLFGVDLTVRRKAANDGSNATSLLVVGWSEPRAVDPQFTELAKPLLLDKIYAPTPYKRQVDLFGPADSAENQPVRTPVNNRTIPY